MTDIYVTKYALTEGIKKYPLLEIHDAGLYVSVSDPKGPNGRRLFHGEDWHRDMTSAVTRAEKMRIAKIASLNKQISRLNKLSFAEGDEG